MINAAVTKAESQFTLAEELLLLAIDPRHGRLVEKPPGSLAYAVAGAMLTGLLHAGQVMLVDGKVMAGTDSGDPLTDMVLEAVRDLSSPQSLGYWVNALALKPFLAQARR